MLFFKLLGGTSIFLSATIFYLETRRFEKEKIKQIDAFISLLRYIKKQVECFSVPISTIIALCDSKILEGCGIDLKGKKEVILSELLQDCDFYIDIEAVEILKKFGDEFGKTYRDDQLKSCDYYISELIKYREKIGQELPKERKMRFAVCFCISASIILLFL